MNKLTVPIMPLWAYIVGSFAALLAGFVLGYLIGDQ